MERLKKGVYYMTQWVDNNLDGVRITQTNTLIDGSYQCTELIGTCPTIMRLLQPYGIGVVFLFIKDKTWNGLKMGEDSIGFRFFIKGKDKPITYIPIKEYQPEIIDRSLYALMSGVSVNTILLCGDLLKGREEGYIDSNFQMKANSISGMINHVRQFVGELESGKIIIDFDKIEKM